MLPLFSDESLTIVYGADYKPFSWIEDGKAVGIQIDFVEEILSARLGIKVRHEAYPWARAQQMVRTGEKDGFFTVPTEERAGYATRSEKPFYITNFVMHTSTSNPIQNILVKIKSLQDFNNHPEIRHVHMLGSGWHNSALKDLENVQTVIDSSVIPRFLIYGRADVYIEQEEIFRYQARAQGLLDEIISISDNPIQSLGWHLFIGNESDYLYLVPEINELLKEMKANGELEELKMRLFSKYGIE